jgi:hypothetical protein
VPSDKLFHGVARLTASQTITFAPASFRTMRPKVLTIAPIPQTKTMPENRFVSLVSFLVQPPESHSKDGLKLPPKSTFSPSLLREIRVIRGRPRPTTKLSSPKSRRRQLLRGATKKPAARPIFS